MAATVDAESRDPNRVGDLVQIHAGAQCHEAAGLLNCYRPASRPYGRPLAESWRSCPDEHTVARNYAVRVDGPPDSMV
jgi:hypothetical protein